LQQKWRRGLFSLANGKEERKKKKGGGGGGQEKIIKGGTRFLSKSQLFTGRRKQGSPQSLLSGEGRKRQDHQGKE